MPLLRPASSPVLRGCLAAGCLLPVAAAWAQSGPGLRLTPTVSLSQTVTDNHETTGTGQRRSEAITTVGAGLRVSGQSAWFRGSLDYSVSGLLHARDTSANELQNRLQAGLQGELVPRHLFVEVAASISQQSVSAFGVQTVDGSASAGNRTEVRVLSVQPTLQGRLGDVANASLAVSVAATDTGQAGSDGQASDSVVGAVSLSLASASAGRLGWSLGLTHSVSDFKAGRRSEEDRATAGLSWRPDPDWQLRLRGGAETNDFGNGARTRYDNWGAGLQWTPSPRTRVNLDGDRRPFGHSHTVALEHRTQRTVWRYSDTQDLTRGAAQTGATLVGAYDLFFELYASQQPDPELRAQLVDSVLERNGLTRDSQVALGFLSSAVTLQRQQNLSFALSAPRSSLVTSVFASRSRRVDSLSTALDDTTTAAVVRQRGLSIALSHQFTPTGSGTLSLSSVRSSDAASLRNELRSLSAAWSERLGLRTSLSLSLRHSEYDADTDAYSENAVIANLNLRF